MACTHGTPIGHWCKPCDRERITRDLEALANRRRAAKGLAPVDPASFDEDGRVALIIQRGKPIGYGPKGAG